MAAVVAALAAAPTVVRVLPVGDSGVGAATLLQRVRASADVGYSGYAQTQGGLALPVSGSAFGAISDLFGGTNQLRVWWRGSDDWRVDTLNLTGETDLHRDAGGLSTWDYENDTARQTTGAAGAVRLPRSDDLLPGNLARRLLSEVRTGDVERLASRRIAGHDAAGLRVAVHEKGSTITRIDVWALPGSGLPVSAAVYTTGSRTALVSSTLLDLTIGRPAASTVAFRPPASVRVDRGSFDDIVAALDTFGRTTPPATVAGLAERRDLNLGAVGVYGRGVTTVVAVPLPARLAGQIVPSLRTTPGAVEDSSGIASGVGALNVQLGPPVGFGDRWLLVGTVTAATLRDALAGLPPLQPYYFGRGLR
ncbi:transcriptional regulator [uncultured Jatrophihabitans sp.]|uniref:transcriptional regulator n=1 Tax=uncultured Jatrophihabitans sp. TaxID=1610747 RepID=UPI0035CA46B9